MGRQVIVVAAAALSSVALLGLVFAAPPGLVERVKALAVKGAADVKAVIDPEQGTQVRWPVLIPDREPDFEWVAGKVTRKKLDKVWAERIGGLLKMCSLADFKLNCKPASLLCFLEGPSGATADLQLVERKGQLFFSQITGAPPE